MVQVVYNLGMELTVRMDAHLTSSTLEEKLEDEAKQVQLWGSKDGGIGI